MIKGFIERYIGPRPKKVNCWYCGQDSYLLPGSGMTPRFFYCHLCENTNHKDENGNIVDHTPSESNPDNMQEQGHCVKTALKLSSMELCENCLADQRMNRMYLNEYIPHENDPTFQSRWESAEAYEKYLDEKTPLCKDCQIKVDRFIAERVKEVPKKLDRKDRNEKERNAAHLSNPSKKFTLIYRSNLSLWFCAHICALTVNAYGYRYPPTSTQVDQVVDNIPVMASRGNNGSWDVLKLAVINIFSKLESSIVCFLSSGNNQEKCAITSDYITFYYILTIASIFVIYWHPLVSLEYEGGDPKAQSYDVYKAGQVVLLVYRMSLPVLLHYAPPELLLGFLVIYISVLYFSTNYVQIQGHRVLRRVGAKLPVEINTPSPIVTPTHSNPKMRTARYINDELKEAMTYKPSNTMDYRDTVIERDDAVHRATYDLNNLRL